MIIFDIETGPLSEEIVLERAKPYTPLEHPGLFNPDSVKLGNIKDPEKIKAKIVEASAKHGEACLEYEKLSDAHRDAWVKAEMGRAALSALTGEVLAIGYHGSDSRDRIQIELSKDTSERDIICDFWRIYDEQYSNGLTMVGHNIFNFDLPFLIRRSWLLGVEVPPSVVVKEKYLSNTVFGCTMLKWSLGDRGSYISLDKLSGLLGGPRKPEGITGAMFADMMIDDETEALEYLKNDLLMTRHVAIAMDFFVG